MRADMTSAIEKANQRISESANQRYYCEACAFEAKRSVDCGGRADSHITQAKPLN